MARTVLVVAWQMQPGELLALPLCHIAHDALRLSVWRAGGVALACRVTPYGVRMVIECARAHDDGQLVAWVRAAARFAVGRYSGTVPLWDDVYTAYRVSEAAVVAEITACWHMHAPYVP